MGSGQRVSSESTMGSRVPPGCVGAYSLYADEAITAPPAAETEAWRRRQLAGLRCFLEAVRDNRARAGLVPRRDSLRTSVAGNEAEDAHGSRSTSGAR
jgi:hypothetical protein